MQLPKVMGDDGEFHAVDEAVDLSGTTCGGWAALALFWLLGACVFYQFFTRYALNDSASWTEEIARYLLIGVVFVGAAIGVAKNNHIQVDLLYRYLPARAGARAGHAGRRAARRLLRRDDGADTVQLMQKMGSYQMTIIDLPMNIVYGVALPAFRGDDAALGAGGARALAARLQRARAARAPRWKTAEARDAEDHLPVPDGRRHAGGHRHGRLVAGLHPLSAATCRRLPWCTA
jgi:hypothetical protein